MIELIYQFYPRALCFYWEWFSSDYDWCLHLMEVVR